MILCGILFVSLLSSAQVRLNVNVNIGAQPRWGPVGYNYVEYYYLPDIETYYYVPTRQFIYLSGDNWVFSYSLPRAYRNYDLYSGYKIVINQPRAYQHFYSHRSSYGKYKSRRGQAVLRDRVGRRDNGNRNRGRRWNY